MRAKPAGNRPRVEQLRESKPGDRIRCDVSRRTRPYTMNVVRDDQIDMKSLELVTTSSAETLTTVAGIPDYPLIYRSLRKRSDVAGPRQKRYQPDHSCVSQVWTVERVGARGSPRKVANSPGRL